MKSIKLLVATAICLAAFSGNTRAQSLRFGEGPEIRLDSLVLLPAVDSLNFSKKPQYNNKNQPVAIPNSYKPKQAPTTPMPVLKIPVCAPEPKKD